MEAEEWGIPYWDSKLYGGQQFERLLAEFKAVADHLKLPEACTDCSPSTVDTKKKILFQTNQ